VDAGILPCGQGVGLVHDIPTIKELFDRIVKEATELAQALASN
jgi:nitronate monooxygenase